MSKRSDTSTPIDSELLAVPNYEVKLFLDPEKILDLEFKPTSEAADTLDLKHSNRKIALLFLDADPPQLNAEGWTVRARKFEDSEKLELSYKRRYPIEAGRLAEALTEAAGEGFDACEDDYAAQVEWGFARQTLSFTLKKEFKMKGAGELELPEADDLRTLAAWEVPGKLDRRKEEGWARVLLSEAHAYGPVLGKRWSSRWQGPDLTFEVYLVRAGVGPGYEPVVELSFKADEHDDADGLRHKLLAFVRDQGWLLDRDVLKTAMTLERY